MAPTVVREGPFQLFFFSREEPRMHVHVAHPDGEAKFWLLLGDEELLLPFSDFPWFRQATVDQLCDVERSTPNHLYWPQLDVDLSVESIRHPEHFPLISKTSANTALQSDTPHPADNQTNLLPPLTSHVDRQPLPSGCGGI